MFIRFFILVCLFCNFGAAGESDLKIDGEGRFISEEGDSLPFIKEQLLFNAFQDVITKYLKRQDLNADLFWEKRNQKFENFFKSIEKDLRDSYQKTEPKSSEGLEKLEREIRTKKLERKAQYGMLNRVIKSYSINSMTRAPNMPKARYISISAQIDNNLINQIYFDYVSPKKIVKGYNLYLLPLFSLSNMSWSDTGVETMKSFSTVVSDHWRKFLEEGLKDQINQIVVLDEESQADLRSVFEGARRDKGFFDLDEMGKSNFTGLDDGFLLLVKVKMKKISEKILLKKIQIEFDLNYVLVDMRNNKIIDFSDIPKKQTSFLTDTPMQLSSSIATSIYRMPLEEFSKIKRDLQENLRNSNVGYLKVNNIKTVEDLFGLQETLKSKGVPFQLNSKIHSLKANEGVLEFEFNGNQDQLTKFLKGIEKEKLVDGREITFEENSGDYTLAIKSLDGPKKLDESSQKEADERKKRIVL
jgi:hypothetical protein